MNVIITPKKLSGCITAPSSKSQAHRFLICASLCEDETEIKLNEISDDISATINCLKAMGCTVNQTDDCLKIIPGRVKNTAPLLNCGESGSTARFLLPVAMTLFDDVTLTGEGRLPRRPFDILCSEMEKQGCSFDGYKLPMKVKGRLKSGVYKLAGDISSQFISGLLMALPNLDGDSEIILTSKLQSINYVKMTIEALSFFGIQITQTDDGYYIRGNQKFSSPKSLTVEGDWSNAAFWIAANMLGSQIEIKGLNELSAQGDRAFSDAANSINIDVSDIPDLVPILAVTAACREGKTYISNAARLRLKESDRLKSVARMIKDLGGAVIELEEGLIIYGTRGLRGGVVDSASDHRIVMAAAIAASVCYDKVKIINYEAVNKSYTRFFEQYKSLGGEFHVE